MKASVPNEHPSIGIEQEFHLIDPETGNLVGSCNEVMQQLAAGNANGRDLKALELDIASRTTGERP